MASLVPCRFNAMQLRAASWAFMSIGCLSVSARSTKLTWPTVTPGKARRELLELGQRMHKPEGTGTEINKGQAGRQAGRPGRQRSHNMRGQAGRQAGTQRSHNMRESRTLTFIISGILLFLISFEGGKRDILITLIIIVALRGWGGYQNWSWIKQRFDYTNDPRLLW